MFVRPIDAVLSGRVDQLPVVLLEATAIVLALWWVVRLLTARPRPRLTGAAAVWQAAYWVFFLGCMVLGLAV